MTAPMPTPTRARAWLLAARVRTLPAAVAPVLVGSAAAYRAHGLAWLPALAAICGAIAIQIGANFANDVYDAEKGADGPNRVGPPRAVASGWISASAMKSAMIAVFALAMLIGGYLTAHAGWPVVAIGLASIAAGIAYTGGPYPLGYNGLGDIFVFLFFGPVAVLGTMYVQLHRFDWVAVLASIGVGALATAILVVNNLRDADTDVAVGKRTVVVRFGKRFAYGEYVAMLVLAAGVAVAMSVWLHHAGPMVSMAVAPLAVRRYRQLRAAHAGPVFNGLLAATAQVLLFYSLLLTVGIALTR